LDRRPLQSIEPEWFASKLLIPEDLSSSARPVLRFLGPSVVLAGFARFPKFALVLLHLF
jgi:hypothetical protein